MKNSFFTWRVILQGGGGGGLAYTSRMYSEAHAMQPEVLYIPYATSLHEQTVNIITFAQF